MVQKTSRQKKASLFVVVVILLGLTAYMGYNHYSMWIHTLEVDQASNSETAEIIAVLFPNGKLSKNGITDPDQYALIANTFKASPSSRFYLDSAKNYFLANVGENVFLYTSAEPERHIARKPIISNINSFDANNWVNRNGKLSELSDKTSLESFAKLGSGTIFLNKDGVDLFKFGEATHLGVFKGYVDEKNKIGVFIDDKSLNYSDGSFQKTLPFEVLLR